MVGKLRAYYKHVLLHLYLAARYGPVHALPYIKRFIGSLSLATKRLILLTLCGLISGVASIYDLDSKPAALNPAENEYWVSIGPVNGSTSAGYNYAALFNPSGSGKTVLAKRVRFNSDAVAVALYQDLDIRRITAASAGTQIAASDIPKKNTDSVNSIAEVRHSGVSTTLVGGNNARLMSTVAASAVGSAVGGRDYTFVGEQLVLQPGEGIALIQTAAGDADQRIRLAIEWEEVAAAPSAQDSYMLAYQRVENAAAIDYKYQTFMNPSGSGKTASISRLNLDVDCDGNATFANQIYIRRITAASAGTQISNSDIMKKHTGSANPVIEARYLGVTATLAGSGDSSIVEVTPCGAARQPHAHRELIFGNGNEEFVLQPGEGIAVVSNAAGNINQLVRLSAVWKETAATPSAQGEYTHTAGPVNGVTTSGYNYISYFNPAASGKTAVVRKLNVRVDAQAAAVSIPITVHRTSAASGGTLVSAADLPKKHTGSANSIMEVRHTNVSATKVGGADARLISVISPSAVGQLRGHYAQNFEGDEQLVLKPGEGIVLHQEGTGDIDFRVKLLLEWAEVTNAPATGGEYMLNAGPISGSTVNGYNYISFYNPSASGKSMVFKRLFLQVDTTGAAVYVPMTLQYTSAASAGTLIAAADVPKKNTSTGTASMEVRTTAPSATMVGGTDARINSVTTPGAIATATAPQLSGYSDYNFSDAEEIMINPGQGIVLYQEAAGNANLRVQLLAEWNEVDTGSAPSSQGEYVVSTGPSNGTTTNGQTYSTFFNPSGSNKNMVIKKAEIRVDWAATGTSYIPASVRRISAASGGSLLAATDIPKKHPSTVNSAAEIRTLPTSATYSLGTDSRYMGVTTPGGTGQDSGLNEASLIADDELVLNPGEGIGLYQEAAGNTGLRFRLRIVWSEKLMPSIDQNAYRFYDNADSITPGAALAAENTPTSNLRLGDPIRLRVGASVSTADVFAGSKKFKLQHATNTGGPWTDVSNGASSPPTTKLNEPSSLPGYNITSAAWSPDNTYLAAAQQSTTYLHIYKRSGDTFTKLADPATLPTSNANGIAWSPDGVYLSVAHLTTPFVTIYKRSGDTFTKLADPATLPGGDGRAVAWSPDGVYMSVAHYTTPFITIYKRSGDTFTKLANPATLPASDGLATGWSPDGNYMTVGHFNTPFITIYERSGDTFTKLANPASLPASTARGVSWSANGAYMSVAHSTSPFVTIYEQSGTTFTKLANPATLPAGTGYGVSWSPDNKYMTVAHAITPFITMYEQSGTTFTKLANPATLPAGDSYSTPFSPDGTYMAVGHATSPYLTIYKGAVASAWRYRDNPAVTDGSTLSSSLLSGSPVAQSYTESNPTAWNPNAITPPNKGEWDFSLDSSIAAPSTTYYFRMTLENGSDFSTYSVYPRLTTREASLTQSTYRWYNNADSVQPGSAKSAENTNTNITAPGELVRLRAAISVSDSSLAAGSRAFKLQHATSTSGPWADVGNSAGGTGWYNASWSNRRKITIDNSASAENLLNFPLRVSLSSSNIDYSKTQNSGQDIRFTDADGTTLLKYEIEVWDETGTSEVWVKVPQIDAASTIDHIYMYYGNGSAADAQDQVNVWNTNYRGVWHMSQTSGAEPNVTSYTSDGTVTGTTRGVVGKIGKAYDFPGGTGTDNVVISDPTDGHLDFGTGSFSYGFWINSDANNGSSQHALTKGGTGVGMGGYSGLISGAGNFIGRSSNGTVVVNPPSTTATFAAWKHVFFVMDKVNNLYRMYVDGVEIGTGTAISATDNFDTTRDLIFGETSVQDLPLDGKLDEPRIMNGVMSADWIEAEFKTQSNTMNSFGLEESSSWNFYGNPTPADGTTLASALLSGSPVVQSYAESNPTVTNPNIITAGQKGEWDFALDSTSATNNTTYYFRIVRSDGTALNAYTVYPQLSIGNTNTAPAAATSLAQQKTNDTAITTGGWNNNTAMKFTASISDPDASDTLQLCIEADAIGTVFSDTEDLCGTAVNYTGTPISASVTITVPTDPGEYHWQARVKDTAGAYSSWVSYGANAESARDFGVDTTAPTGGMVYDGTTTDVDAAFNDGSLSALSANWSGISSALSGLQKYDYSIGTSAGATDVRGWTDNGTSTTVTATGLTLQTSNKYFMNVRTTDNAGNTTVISSNGQLVAPSVSFSVSPATVTFSNLNPSNQFTDTKATTLTTSTNAYGGYVVRSFVTDLLRSAGNQTIGAFSGGTYASPDSWQSGDTGFGYTSSDSLVQGTNKFQAATCPGGSALASPGCYAPFASSGPGDIVADHTSAVSGSPITDQQFTITYRITTNNTQAASRYNTNVVYTVTPVY